MYFFDIVKFHIHHNKFNKTMILELEHHLEFLVTGLCIVHDMIGKGYEHDNS